MVATFDIDEFMLILFAREEGASHPADDNA